MGNLMNPYDAKRYRIFLTTSEVLAEMLVKRLEDKCNTSAIVQPTATGKFYVNSCKPLGPKRLAALEGYCNGYADALPPEQLTLFGKLTNPRKYT